MTKAIDLNSLSQAEVRDLIDNMERLARRCDEIEIPLTHHFSKGVYAREIFIPKGSFIVGKIHKHENLNILSKGHLTLFSVQGHKEIRAPFTVVSPPGVKRVAYAHEDSVWTTIHGTNETDLEKIEEEFIVKSYDQLIESKEVKCLG